MTIEEFAKGFPGTLTLGCDFKVAALFLAGKSWPVFPVKSGGKVPLCEHGLKDATTDPAKIEEWAKRWPSANVGYATGTNVVLDLDPRASGNESLAELEKIHGLLPDTLTVATAGGGKHFYFRSDSAPIRNSASKLGAGLDVRGAGGYVVTPPSVGESGKRYEWLRRVQPVALPPWLKEKMLAASDAAPASTNGNGAVLTGDEVPQGQRHQRMLKLAASLRNQGFSSAAILSNLCVANALQCKPPLDEADLAKLAAWAGAKEIGGRNGRQPMDKSEKVLVQSFSTIESESVEYLWEKRIALGKLNIFASDPGKGKSLISNDIAARISRAGSFPDGSAAIQGAALFLTAEDGRADTIRPRLEAHGADLSFVHFISGTQISRPDGTTGEAHFNLERDIETLDAAVAAIPDLRLLVVDPIDAYLGSVDSHRNSDVRRILTPLAELSERRRIATLLIMHLKKSETSAMLAVSGSIGFVAAARTIWGFADDPTLAGFRVMVPIKNSLAKLGDGLSYRIIPFPQDPGVGFVEWSGGLSRSVPAKSCRKVGKSRKRRRRNAIAQKRGSPQS